MPTYEFVCPKCHRHFEQFQKMSDPPLKRCPHCKKLGLKRLVGAGAGLIFKGSGFYITDYKNKGMKPKEGGEGKTEAKGGGDAKPAATEAKPAADSKPAAKESKSADK